MTGGGEQGGLDEARLLENTLYTERTRYYVEYFIPSFGRNGMEILVHTHRKVATLYSQSRLRRLL